MVASIRQRTYCLWEYLDSCPDLVNKNFIHKDDFDEADVLNGKGCLLMPLSCLLRNVTLWTDRHCMHSAKPSLRSIPMHHYEYDLPEERLSQPLCSSKDVVDCSIKTSIEEAEKWKLIAQEKEAENLLLRQQLDKVKENV